MQASARSYPGSFLLVGRNCLGGKAGLLRGAYQRGDTNYLFVVKVDPMLDDLRGNPRFELLVQKTTAGK